MKPRTYCLKPTRVNNSNLTAHSKLHVGNCQSSDAIWDTGSYSPGVQGTIVCGGIGGNTSKPCFLRDNTLMDRFLRIRDGV